MTANTDLLRDLTELSDCLAAPAGVARYTERIMARQVAVSSLLAQDRAGGLPEPQQTKTKLI